MARIDKAGLQWDAELAAFVEIAADGTGVPADNVFAALASLVAEFGPENRALLQTREKLQEQIDDWHRDRAGNPHDPEAYKSYLEGIGYLVPPGPDFQIETANVDPEIASTPGPQLVVPIDNARYAINAANARWGSLYDALYGTDAMGNLPDPGPYDRGRGARVIARARVFLDDAFPLRGASHADVTTYQVADGALLGNGKPLRDPDQFIGYRGEPQAPEAILLRNNGLHTELVFDAQHAIGKRDQAHLADVILEAAITAIVDCEDSVAAVDAADKRRCYANWLGLMKGDLTAEVTKGDQSFTRRLAPDRPWTAPHGTAFEMKGRALLWIRNVGHLMTTPAVLTAAGDEVPEGLLDALMTTLIGKHDLARAGGNSSAGSIYVVKPKMHGPEEVAFTDRLFTRVEKLLALAPYTVKVGIMDEERRTSVNLKACIRAARHRVAFINTGFLDRTGDEIHTSMEAGPFSRKDFIKRKSWITAYEDRNVDIGLACGFAGRAQIGKGMWAMPDRMGQMLSDKIAHPKSGASCAWVPSPTAATLHALHYHQIDVRARQAALLAGGPRGHVETLLEIPLARFRAWSAEDIAREVENNAQGILGYVVRWIDRGVGCSKVPDVQDVGLMEDRATCRISSQHIANWLRHDIVTQDTVMDILRRMATVVDAQNAQDPDYVPMAPGYDGLAFQAACDLVFRGTVQPSGYTEPILHTRRLELKGRQS